MYHRTLHGTSTFQVETMIHALFADKGMGVRTVLVVCPLSTVLNWVNEFKMWLEHVRDVDENHVHDKVSENLLKS